jgi:cytochrome oxidase Cu insertion factor (SCO1/SenC/PrrC family)
MAIKSLLVTILCVLLFGCSGPNTEEVESTIEMWLGIDVPSNFAIVKGSNSFAPTGDDVTTVDIEYNEKDFNSFLSLINLQEWELVQYGYQLVLRKDLDHSRLAFFHISVDPERSTILHIQYGWE